MKNPRTLQVHVVWKCNLVQAVGFRFEFAAANRFGSLYQDVWSEGAVNRSSPLRCMERGFQGSRVCEVRGVWSVSSRVIGFVWFVRCEVGREERELQDLAFPFRVC